MVPGDEAGQEQERKREEQKVSQVGGEVHGAFQLDEEGQAAPPDRGQDLFGHLQRPFGPAVLLGAEGADVHGELRRADHIGEEQEPPAFELGPVGQVQVLGEGVVVPSARLLDGAAAPDPGGAVEIEEGAGPVAGRVLQDEMAVQEERLHPRQERVIRVDVAPPGLHHAQGRVREMGDGPAQEVRGRQEVRVEDGQELTLGQAQAVGQGPGLEAVAVRPGDAADVEAQGAFFRDLLFHQRAGFIGGVIQNLDLQQPLGVIQAADRLDHAVRHVVFVVQGQLHRDPGPDRRVRGRGQGRRLLVVPPVQVQDPVPVNPVQGQDQQHGHVRQDDQFAEHARNF